MSTLNDLFKIYKKTNLIKMNPPKTINKKTLEFGDVIELYHPYMVAVAISEDEAILMSEFWEFATNTDLFLLNVQHPIGNKWIAELDKILYLNDNPYFYVSSLTQEDAKALKDALDGRIDTTKTGPKLPFNPKDPRYKFKKEELKKTLLFNNHLFFE